MESFNILKIKLNLFLFNKTDFYSLILEIRTKIKFKSFRMVFYMTKFHYRIFKVKREFYPLLKYSAAFILLLSAQPELFLKHKMTIQISTT